MRRNFTESRRAASGPGALRRLFPRLELAVFPGGQKGEETPVPIPNTEVKGPVAEGTGRFAPGRVGSRRDFFSGVGAMRRPPFFVIALREDV